MNTDRRLSTVCAFDITAEGIAHPIDEAWPGLEPADGAAYRWLHLNLDDPQAEPWLDENFPPIVAEALQLDETRPRCDRYGEGLMLNLRGINLNPGQDAADMISLRLWVAADLIVTTRHRRIFAIDDIRELAAAGDAPTSPGALLATLGRGLTARIEDESLSLEDATDTLEDATLERESTNVGALHPLRRRAARLRRYVGPQREALSRLHEIGPPILAEADLIELREAANRTMRAVEELDMVRDRLVSLQEHIDSRNAMIIGRNGYILSIIAAIFLPLGFLTGLFGVNVAGMPGATWPWSFAFLTGASILIGVLLFLLFRILKWF